MRIRKAVMPVAGLGTRILPASKVIPKPMFPVVDKPTVQYNVEEAVKAGIEEIIFVTSRSTRSIEDHFDLFPELEDTLKRKGKQAELEEVRNISRLAAFTSVRQSEPLGLGHAVLCAKELVGDEPFAVLLGDDMIDPATPCLPEMMNIHETYGSSVLALFPVAPEEVSSYGVAEVEELEGNALHVTSLVEKPAQEEAPSNLIVLGRYIFTPDIFDALEQVTPDKGGEIQLTAAILKQAEAGKCNALKFSGKYYDTGRPDVYLKTSIAYALQRPELAPALRAYMRSMLEQE